MSLKEQVKSVLLKHKRKAEQNAYDRKVIIIALGYAEQVIESFNFSQNHFNQYVEDLNALVASLERLTKNYNDTSGQYTSGKGSIGSLTREIAGLADKYWLPTMVDNRLKISLKPKHLFIPKAIIEGEVVITEPHFVIRYGDFMNDEILIDIMRIGLAKSKQLFVLEWFYSETTQTINEQIITNVAKEISYYLHQRPQEKANENNDQELMTIQRTWEYMKYHATGTSANLYGDIHWAYISDKNQKTSTAVASDSEVKMTIWQKLVSYIQGR